MMHKTEKKVAKLKDEVRRKRRQHQAKRNTKKHDKEKKAEEKHTNEQNQEGGNGKLGRWSRGWKSHRGKKGVKIKENGNSAVSEAAGVESSTMNPVGTASDDRLGAEIHREEMPDATGDSNHHETPRIRGGGKRRRSFMRGKKKQQHDEETGEPYWR